jgi:hypothetical protein
LNVPIRNMVALAVLFVLAKFIAQMGSIGWADAFINDRTFTVYFNWFSWGTVIAWIFPALTFGAIGALVAALFVAWNPLPWAFLLGLTYSIDRWAHSTYRVHEMIGFIVYIDLYGALFIPPLAACGGAWAWRSLASRYGKLNAA